MSEAQAFHEIDECTTVVRRVDPIKVYTNPDGDIVIRQYKEGLQDSEDVWVVIPLDQAGKIADAIYRMVSQERETRENT